MSRILSHSEEQTIEAGRIIAGELGPGSAVALYGDLGTGKTRFIKGVCAGLGVQEHVASPTFTIVNEYQGERLRVYHFDFYRMRSVTELREIGFDEYLSGDGVCVIEWADRVQDQLPTNRYDVRLQLGEDESSRVISVQKMVGVAAR